MTTDPSSESAGGAADTDPSGEPRQDNMADVLASIRALVSAEATARTADRATEAGDDVLMLTPEMRVETAKPGAKVLAPEGDPTAAAPILDEEALRGVINAIVREELQGELGERISRNLHKIVRREIYQALRGEEKSD